MAAADPGGPRSRRHLQRFFTLLFILPQAIIIGTYLIANKFP